MMFSFSPLFPIEEEIGGWSFWEFEEFEGRGYIVLFDVVSHLCAFNTFC